MATTEAGADVTGWEAARRKVSRVVHRARLLGARHGWAEPRHAQPYATHVPVLVGVGVLLRPRTVLELGCGEYSTAAFLDGKAFPSLERLDSYETDPAWGAKVGRRFADDDRFGLHVVAGSASDAVAQLDLAPYDLIFVDDSTAADERAATIRAVARGCRRDAVVVIHDFEVQPYREASLPFRHRWPVRAFNPQTGVCAHRTVLSRGDVRALDRRIRASKGVDPADRAAWAELLSEQ